MIYFLRPTCEAYQYASRALFASLDGKGSEGKAKKEETKVEEVEKFEREEV
jgi:hypothetical protein